MQRASAWRYDDPALGPGPNVVVEEDDIGEEVGTGGWLQVADATMSPLKEKVLVRKLKEQDERAFSEFVAIYKNQVFNLVFRMLGNREEAEDVAQDVFVTVFKNIGTFRGECRLSTWIYRIATNHCRNRIKYLSRRRVHEHRQYEEELGKVQPSDSVAGPKTTGQVARPDQMVEGLQMERLVQKAIASLDEDHREVIVLRDIQNLTYQEISEITGLAAGTVKSRLHRARLALRDNLKGVI